MIIPPLDTDRTGDLIDAGAALAQELQDVLDAGLESEGATEPAAGSSLAHVAALIADWERAYAAASGL